VDVLGILVEVGHFMRDHGKMGGDMTSRLRERGEPSVRKKSVLPRPQGERKEKLVLGGGEMGKTLQPWGSTSAKGLRCLV